MADMDQRLESSGSSMTWVLLAVAVARSHHIDEHVLETAAQRFDFEDAAVRRIDIVDEGLQTVVVGTAHDTNRIVGVELALGEFASDHAARFVAGDDDFHLAAVCLLYT